MLSDQYKRQQTQLIREAGNIRTDIGKAEEDAGKARAEAGRKRVSALKATAASIRDMYIRAAETEDKKVVAAEKRIGSLHAKLATNADRQRSTEQSWRSAEKNEQATAARAAEAQTRREKAERDTRDRADAKRRQIEKDHAREVTRLSRPTVHHIYLREPEPEKLRVLYLTASPIHKGAVHLRVDAEVNNVLKALRSAKHRDLVDLQHRPAASVDDLVNGLNDHRPHVVHFSGHADGGLLFDNASIVAPSEHLVGYEAVAKLLAATDQPPTLVVLNACKTTEAVTEILSAAAVVIAMTDTVGDASAAVFATHFYGAIAAAQTIGDAVSQARAMISIALPDEPDLVTVCAAECVDPEMVRLVQPK